MMARDHAVHWAAPNPLWKGLAGTPNAMRKPALLAFGSDQFMNELIAVLGSKPDTLSKYSAKFESRREPPVGEPDTWQPSPPGKLKLFQPVHGRFYLVAASLVCQRLGLPDHRLDIAHEERASFVLRRKDTDGSEMAWVVVADATDPKKSTHQWQKLTAAQAKVIATDEEVLPLFPVNVPDPKQPRRLHAGVIPTSSYDSFASAALVVPDTPAAPIDLRKDAAHARVVEPFSVIRPATAHDPPLTFSPTALQAQKDAAPFILVDFADVLRSYLSDLFDAITAGATPPSSTRAVGKLYTLLESSTADSGRSWAEAITEAWNARALINEGQAGPTFDLSQSSIDADQLGSAIDAALDERHDTPTTAGTLAVVPKFGGDATTTYVIRCFFRRPLCGPLHPDVASDPSDEFQLAQYFDSDAPARTIRIPMPVDTSAAGLRKFPKSVGFLLSDQLQKQICQVSDLAGVLKGNVANCDELKLGEICSFSIPIITIVAMMLLMMFVILLNIVFWWLPFLKVCIPIPLKAKS